MTLSILGLTLSYVAIAVLLLIFLQTTPFHWLPKAVVIVMVTVFYFVVYTSYSGLLGWATENRLPDHFKYHFSLVEEPSKTDQHRQGDIFIWITAIGIDRDLNKPRAYKVPYSKDTHKKLVLAQKKVQEGVEQLGEVISGKKGVDAIGNTVAGNSIILNFYDVVGVKVDHK
jgi:hypothetical protein